MFKGPRGGLDCPKSNEVISDVESGVRPVSVEARKQATPALAPVLATHTSFLRADRATVTGKSPSVDAGLPTRRKQVASSGEIANSETVLDPAFTAARSYTHTRGISLNPSLFAPSLSLSKKETNTYIPISPNRTLTKQHIPTRRAIRSIINPRSAPSPRQMN